MSTNDPTHSDPKFVGTVADRTRFVRSVLYELVRFLRNDVPVTEEGGGDLSSWILRLHGFTEDQSKPLGYAIPNFDPAVLDKLGQAMARMATPNLDPRFVAGAVAESEKLRDETIRKLRQIPGANLNHVDAAVREVSPMILGAWGLPSEYTSQFQLSVATTRQMLRAFRALALCLELHKTHVISLIARAIKGDRQAVLDLIKVDKMFVHDSCTARVVKSATMGNDRSYLDQLARAQEYRFELKIRAVHHVYLFFLFEVDTFCRALKMTHHELWWMVDPHAKTYKTLESFERDFQRRKSDFGTMLSDALKEIGCT